MKHSLFRYFDKEVYAQEFLEGKIFCHNLQYYVNIEDRQVRGDTKDGSLVHRPTSGLVINNLTQGESSTLSDVEFNSMANIEDIYALCMSESLSTKMVESFQAVCCVEVNNKRLFLESVRTQLEAIGNTSHIGSVTYYDPSEPPLGRWAVPEKICLRKTRDYRWQDEYRVAFGKPEQFGAYNVKASLRPTNRVADDLQNGLEKHLTFNVGNIRDYCIIHNFK